jgi:hypothetical protein
MGGRTPGFISAIPAYTVAETAFVAEEGLGRELLAVHGGQAPALRPREASRGTQPDHLIDLYQFPAGNTRE